MNEEPLSIGRKILDAILANLPVYIIGAIGALVAGALFLGSLYWGLANTVGDCQRWKESSQFCNSVAACPAVRDLDEHSRRADAHIAEGVLDRKQAEGNSERNSEDIHELRGLIYQFLNKTKSDD